MSKITPKIFVILIYLIFYLFLPSSAGAVGCSLVETNPDPIYTESENATFKIDVGNNNEPGIESWKTEFQCGARYQQTDASKNPDSKTISSTIQRSRIPGQGCEFSEGSHIVGVKAINNNGNWLDWCTVSYKVTNPDLSCKLSITPSAGLTPNSTIKVSGENLTSGGQFVLFIDKDDNRIKPGIVNFVDTPTFLGITIPKEYLPPAKHTLYLKKLYPVTLPGGSQLSAPLCPLEFTIGTESLPGSVTGGTAGGSSGSKSPPTSGGGTSCGDKNSPGISTAIGCIHTNPVDFIKDALRFLTAVAGGLAFLLMLLGAFQMITSAGNPETLQAGRDRFQSALIGLLLVIFAVLLLQIIGVGILGIPGFTK